MPGRQNPTFRQRRLGSELRRMREQAGLGGSELARALGVSPAQVTQMENGKTSVSADRLRTIATACKSENRPLISALNDIISSRGKGWWEQYRNRLPDTLLASAEHEDFAAGTIRSWTSPLIPGPLQTKDYARGMFNRRIPRLPDDELELRIDFRAERRNQILRSPHRNHEVYLHESSLLTRFGGTHTLIDQLRSLIDDSHREDVRIHVVPFTADTYPGPIENLVYSFGVVPELDTVEVETSAGPMFFDSLNDLDSYRKIFDRIEKVALSEERSRDLIHRTVKDLKG
ncbi:helix-turn-helix domain-containing protein [Streptomyces sp. NRRL S-350]|uniref:helix-turn-helix domain-containing protein n=1 Tax=Streptomyces sp. NRRL S-350 TaxID=1463902 RepID=UPI0004C2412C|nr:helix-turn-helix transcriptional regulator [Streptomyces sp. NRRL S-350]